MRHSISCLFKLIIILLSCNSGPGRPNINWEKEWERNHIKLKALAQDILIQGRNKYSLGINEFPANFNYPFDNGFAINNAYNSTIDSIDKKNLTIKFYIDRGLLDHYSAIIYSNDSTYIEEIDRKVKDGGNDFKIEANWYIVND